MSEQVHEDLQKIKFYMGDVRDTGFRPQTSLREGLRNFACWYREFYGKDEHT